MKTNKKDKEIKKLKQALSKKNKEMREVKKELMEINLLNAKIFYTQKLFKEFSLENSTKLDIVDRMDTKSSVKEVKDLYRRVQRENVTLEL